MISSPPAATLEHRHPMRVVTRRTGLSADLLRAWERRHEVVAPVRSPGGRRLYSDGDIERLRLLYRATLAGRSIGQVAALPDEQLAALVRADAVADRSDPGTAPTTNGVPSIPLATDFLGECLHAVGQLDVFALDATLRRALVLLSAEAFLDAVVVPLLARLRAPALRPVHRHLALPVLRRAIDRVTETATSPLAEPDAVVTTPGGPEHELGALLAAAAAAAEGWRVTYLGAGLPAEAIAEVAAHTGARAVVLSPAHPAGGVGSAHELRRLAALVPDHVALVGVGDDAAAPADGRVTQAGDLAGLRAALRALRGEKPGP